MMDQHPHAELIKLWADGVVIQKLYKSRFFLGKNFFSEDNWVDDKNPTWDFNTKYRPKPSQDRILIMHLICVKGLPQMNPYAKPNIKFVFDHLTGEPKEVEILK